MQYVSREPRITGWYDADQLHSRIDQAVSEGATSNYEVQKVLANEAGTWDMFKIAGATWNTPLKSFGFGSTTTDGDINTLIDANPGQHSIIDGFHPDTVGGSRFFTLPEILTASSCYPTQFLIGRVSLPKGSYRSYRFFSEDFWESEAGRQAVQDALRTGDATLQSYDPGDILRVPGGALHRRDTPVNAPGYRYFTRLFPTIYTGYCSSELALLRPS